MELTLEEYYKRYYKALSVPFHLERVCSASLYQFVKAHAKNFQCSEQCFFYPLLSCCATCMGKKSHLEITSFWQEPLIIWTLVLAPKSEQHKCLTTYLKQELQAALEEFSGLPSAKLLKNDVTFPDQINIDTLQSPLTNNSNGQVLGLYYGTSALENCASKQCDDGLMTKFLSSSSWFSCSGRIKDLHAKTQLNFSVLSSPETTHKSINVSQNFREIYNELFLTVVAEKREFRHPLSILHGVLQNIFKYIMELHLNDGIVYKLSKEAFEKFQQVHNEITLQAQKLGKESFGLIFFPAGKYLARITCVLHVLNKVFTGFCSLTPFNHHNWNSEINAVSVSQAGEVLKYAMQQRRWLLQPPNNRSPFDLPDETNSI